MVLETQLRLLGGWHLYRQGEVWKKPQDSAHVVVEVDEWVAACFNSSSVETYRDFDPRRHPLLGTLGPDLRSAIGRHRRVCRQNDGIRGARRDHLGSAARPAHHGWRRQCVSLRNFVGLRDSSMGTNWYVEARRVSRACAVGIRNVAIKLCSPCAQERRGCSARFGRIRPTGQSLSPLWRLDSSCPPRRSQQGAVLVPRLPNGPSAFGQAEFHAVID